jgi:hypothetical protein
MIARGSLIALLLLAVLPEAQPRWPIHVQSLIYPALGRSARIQGDIVLTAQIGSDGSVSIPARNSGHPMLIKVAEDNLMTWRFPKGESHEMKITYYFRLRERPSGSHETECAFDFPDSVTVTADPPPVKTIGSSPKVKSPHQ